MYGQGGYNPQFRQGPHTPMPPPYQQYTPGQPLPPHFQQGPPAPPSSGVKQGHPPGPPHVGQTAASTYQHGPPAQTAKVHQVSPSGMPNTSQSYLQPPPPPHGSIPFSHMHPTSQLNSQRTLHLGPLNVYHRPQQVPPPLGQPFLPPPPPPIPSQGQPLYINPVHPPPQQPSGQSLQNIIHPPPPPPISNYPTSSPSGGFLLPAVPPPPPSSPPPVPPSPPQISVDKVVALNQGRENVPLHDDLLNQGSRSVSVVGSLLGVDVSSQASVVLVHSPPPPKPTEEKVVQKIEVFCQSIAKNGPVYEDMAHRNESGNPEFEFLFGGEPGSEAAIAHEYFLWMKKKHCLACKSDEEKSHPPLRSLQTDYLAVAAGFRSPAESDMEMEDDITQVDHDQGVNYPVGDPNCKSDLICNELVVKEQLPASRSSADCNPSKDVLFEKVPFEHSSVLDEEGPKVISNHDGMVFRGSVPRVHSPIMNSTEAAEQAFASNLEKSSTPLVDGKSASQASAAAEGVNSEKNNGLLTKGTSPFRLIQEYASDDGSENDAEPCLEDVSPVTVSPSVGLTSLHRDAGFSLDTDIGSKNCRESENVFGPFSESRMLYKGSDMPPDSQRKIKETVMTSSASGMTDEHVSKKHENPASIKHAASPEAFQKKDAMGGTHVVAAFTGELQKENEAKNVISAATQPKVDEFGRLPRKGASDSDSDDSHYGGRRRRTDRSWSRSRSRSRSPLERRKSRRYPWSRREKRSRSHSWSPRNRRSRSRSPSFRRVGDFSGDNTRRDKGRIPVCFDFLRGRCYRGMSCRFSHHDSQKSDGSRRHRSKQECLDVLPSSKTSNAEEEIKHIAQKVLDSEHDYVKNAEIKICQDMAGSSCGPTLGRNIDQKRDDYVSDALQSGICDKDGHLIDSQKSESCGEVSVKVQASQVVQEAIKVPTPIDESYQGTMESHQKPIGHCDASHSGLSPLKKSEIQQCRSNLSDPVLENNDFLPQQTDNSSLSDSSPDQTSKTALNKLPVTEAFPDATQPPSQGVNAPHMTHPPSGHNLTPQTLSGDSFPSYMLPNQDSNFYGPPNSSWTSLPPPPPLPSHDLTHSASSQFQQSHLPPRNNFGFQNTLSPYATELPSHSLVGGFQQQAYPSIHERHRPLLHAPMPIYNPPNQQFGGHLFSREDHLTQHPMPGFSASNSFPQGNNHLQTVPSLQELPANKMQPFPGDNLPPGELSKSSSQIHPYSQQQQPPYSFQHPAADSLYNLPGKISSSLRYPPDVLDTNQPSLPDFRGSRSSTYHNPYASTFDRPLSSKFSSDTYRQEKDATYSGTPFSLSHVPADGQGVSSVGSKRATSSPNSTRAVRQNFAGSGGNQYDPLFDSIEPSSSLSKKFDHSQKWEPTSDTMLRISGSNKPLDIEENNKRKESGAVAPATSVDNEEFGETADAEVGAVENGSPSSPADLANMNTGEIEIDQIKSPGKSKKNKESRSMKVFKFALAEFVKEVLKPSWRQGSMSKEAFKTIVKKTVDKVSGAMKSHQIPKSRAKIDQYIDSSQRKLTKLVMGYVDKYVKV